MRTHPGELHVQHESGYFRDGLGSAGMGVRLPEAARRFLTEQRMLIIGGYGDAGSLWASPLYGPAGFLRAEGDRDVIAEAVPAADDPLAGAFRTPGPVGAIAIEPATRRRMRVNGQGRSADGRLVITADQVFANCPKHISTREVQGETETGPPAPAGDRLSAEQLRFVADADTFFIASGADGHGLDVSHRGGPPGFVTATGATTLSWPEYRGNAMYMTLGNLHLQPRCGLLFLDWTGTRPALRLTGRASADPDAARLALHPGAERMIDFVVDRVVETAGHTLVWRSL